jgi:very-short-patch-repair endonuclease
VVEGALRASNTTYGHARQLRRRLTAPEVRLWVRLRAREPGRPAFRRQHPVGRYVLDFYCPAARLCVEVDGWGHNMGSQPARDEQRDSWLESQGMATLRIEAVDVLKDPDVVADMIVDTAIARCAETPSTAFGGPPPP